MQTNRTRGTARKRRGRRAAATLLAVATAMSINTGAFAAIGGAGASVQPSVHLGRSVHHPNGKELAQEAGEGVDTSPFDFVSGYGGTIYVGVGETVTVHLLQRAVSLFGIEGFQKIYWYDSDGRDYKATVGFSSSIDGLPTDQFISKMHKYEAKNDSAGMSTAYCLDLFLTGKKPGTEYFWYEEGGGLEGSYYKVVVLGAGEKAENAQGSSKGTQPSSGGSGTSSGTSGGANDGAAKDNPSAPATVPDHLVVREANSYTVQAGDTLASIALNVYGDMACWPQLQAANADALAQTKDGRIFAGLSLYLPDDIGSGQLPAPSAGSGEALYTVRPGDTLATIAAQHFGDATRYKEIYDRNSDRIRDVHTLYEGQVIVLP